MGTRTEILGRVPISRGKYNEQETYYMQNIVLYANGSYMVCVPEITGIPPINDEGNLNDGWDVNNAIPVVQKPGENEQVVMSQKAVTETYGDLVENPEYIEVTVDAEGKVLEGIKADGQKFLAKPSNQDEILQNNINIQQNNISEINEKIGSEAHDVEINKPNPENPENPETEIVHVEATGIYKKIDDVSENIVTIEEKVSDFSHEENPEYLEVTTDAEGKVLEGIKVDGTKYFGNKIQQGNVLNSEVVDNPEYLEVTTDAEGKVLEGITVDGQKYLGKPSNQDEILQQQINNISETVTEDLQEKVDNAVTEINTKVNDAVEQLDEKLENLPFESIENPEYMDVTLDLEDKVLEGITTDGVKQVNIPHSFNRPVTFNDEIEMGEKGQSSIINIIRNCGLIKDISFRNYLNLPIPTQCGAVRLTGKIPTSKFGENIAVFEYFDCYGNYVSKKCIWMLQGRSSQSYTKKNFAIDLLNDDDTEFAIKFGNWPVQDSFHLKGNGNDFLAVPSYLPYRWHTLLAEARPQYNQYPYESILKYAQTSVDDIIKQGSGKIKQDFKPDGKCHPDGFPVMLFITDESKNYVNVPWGLYFVNLKKSKEVYNIDKNSDDASQIAYVQESDRVAYMERFNEYYWKITNYALTNTEGIEQWSADKVYEIGDVVWDSETFDFTINGNTSSVTIKRKFECIRKTEASKNMLTTKPSCLYLRCVEIRQPKELVTKQKDGSFKQYAFDSPSDYVEIGYYEYTHFLITEDDLDDAIAYNVQTDKNGKPKDSNNKIIGSMKSKNWKKACQRSVLVNKKFEHRSKLIPVIENMTAQNISDWGFETEQEAIRKLLEENFYLDYLYDYFILHNVICLADAITNNNVNLIYDGQHALTTLYDTDCCLWSGSHGPGIEAFPSGEVSKSISTVEHSWMYYLWQYYSEEIKQRYAELRDSKIIDSKTFDKLIDDHISQIGLNNIEEELRVWNGIAHYRTGKYWFMDAGECLVGEDEDGLLMHYFDESKNTRNASYEEWESGKYYAAGSFVNYGDHSYKCSYAHTADKNNRPDKAYSCSTPQLGGFYDTPRTRKEWVKKRIDNLDNLMNYNN